MKKFELVALEIKGEIPDETYNIAAHRDSRDLNLMLLFTTSEYPDIVKYDNIYYKKDSTYKGHISFIIYRRIKVES